MIIQRPLKNLLMSGIGVVFNLLTNYFEFTRYSLMFMFVFGIIHLTHEDIICLVNILNER